MRDALLRWYDASARDLPWRRTRDPYAIWVSEIMLQQTRVDTVVPYFARFMERFPTPGALARAGEDEVLAMWSGLGYYRRARLLHAGVREVVAKYGGRVPEDPDARRALPGVGRYTAGAIGSIAFDRAEPIVDGNVARVLARVRGIDTPLGRADTERVLWAEAEAIARGPRPGALNQAMMELGATVCTPVSPSCERCPIASDCVARRDGRASELPVARAKTPPREVRLVAVVATSSDAVWLERGEGTLFGGLWGVPMQPGDHGDRATAREVLRRAHIAARLDGDARGTVDHVLSHRKMQVEVWRATAARSTETETRRRVPRPRLSTLGISTLTKKILAVSTP